MVVEVFLLICYCAGTYMGYRFARIDPQFIIESTIDKLIHDGYIKTQKIEDEVELLKYWETPKEVDSESK